MKKSSDSSMLPFEAEDAAKLLAAKIRTARIARGWSQDELAQRCDISKRTISNIEAGAVSVQFGFLLKALWAVGLIDDFLKHIKAVGINDHEFALLEASQPLRVREKGRI
jgi:transcriptional regulator with XRE-family HTH domain